jgi:hypothetical protein
MKSFRKYMPHIVAAIVGAVMAAAPSQARADFELRFSTNGGGTFSAPVIDAGMTVGGITFFNISGISIGSVTVSATGSANTSTGATTVDLGVTGAEAANSNYIIQVALTSVLTAPPPQTITYSQGNATNAGVSNPATVKEQGWVTSSTTAFNTAAAQFNTGNNTVPLASTVTGSGTVNISTVPYQVILQTQLINSSTTLPSGSMSTDNSLSITPAPAPAGIILALSGSPAFGLIWLRRRK